MCFFEIILRDGLDYVLEHTELLGRQPVFDDRDISFEKVIRELTLSIRHKQRFKDYSEENLGDIASGILLGYPDKAISESVLLREKDDPFMEPLIDADIRGAGYYICPKPVYYYPRHLVNDADINAHEKLWSNILSDYYHSGFHQSLEKDEAFLAKMQALDNLR